MNLREAYENLHRSQEAREGRVYYSVVGEVTDIEDPTSSSFLGRVKARIASQMASEDLAGQPDRFNQVGTTDWLSPMWQGGIESVPRKGDQVLVSFQDGDPQRGYYSWHPDKSTKNRASEWAVLGLTQTGIINYLVDQFNQLRTDFNTFAGVYSGHTHPAGTPSTGTPSATQSSTSASAGVKGQKADGSTVANVSSDSKVLSGRVKVQI